MKKSSSSNDSQNPEDPQANYEAELKQLQEKFRKELSSKDRQIESLEEQLQHHNKIEIKKLKRGSAAKTPSSGNGVKSSRRVRAKGHWGLGSSASYHAPAYPYIYPAPFH